MPGLAAQWGDDFIVPHIEGISVGRVPLSITEADHRLSHSLNIVKALAEIGDQPVALVLRIRDTTA